jgi:flagellar protein FliS
MRAIAILFALEGGLDFDKGGEAAKTFASLYRGARKSVIDATMSSNANTFLDIANNIAQIAAVWKSLRPV